MNLHQEIRALNTTADLIENLINYQVCCLPADRLKIVDSLLPQNYISKKYFFILLLEIIAGVNGEMIPDKERGDSLLDILNKISNNPNLNSKRKAACNLSNSTEEFQNWLCKEFQCEIYSANIVKEITIKLSRKDALYLIGNRCKHTLTRSNSILKKLLKIYRDSGVKIDVDKEVLLLDDIDVWLFEDFGGYHFTKLCELCANVFHAINDYVGPEVILRLRKEGETKYSFDLPESLKREDEVFEFYRLFNRFRNPWMPKFATSDVLVGKY